MTFTFKNTVQEQSKKSSKTAEQIYGFLKANRTGVLSTVNPEGDPNASVIYFTVNDIFELTFTTKRDTRKHDNIQHNNHVQLTVYETGTQTMVQVTGVAQDVSDTPESQAIFRGTLEAALNTSLAGIPPVSKMDAGYYVAYRLQPKQIRMAVFSGAKGDLREMFKTLDF